MHDFQISTSGVSTQPITQQQPNACRHVDRSRRHTEVQTEHQNGAER